MLVFKMNWYKMAQQEIDYDKAFSLEKWIISIAKRMYDIFVSFSGGQFSGDDGGRGDYKKYMQRTNPLIKTLKIYIDKLKGYPTVSQGIERQIVESAKNSVGNLTSLDSHTVTNNLQGLFALLDGYSEK